MARRFLAVPSDISELSVAEAQELSDDLLSQIGDVELQLGEPVRKGPDGKRLSTEEYSRWRRNAMYALHKMAANRKRLKKHISEEKRKAVAAGIGLPPNPTDLNLLEAAYSALVSMSGELEPTEDEKDLIYIIRRRILE